MHTHRALLQWASAVLTVVGVGLSGVTGAVKVSGLDGPAAVAVAADPPAEPPVTRVVRVESPPGPSNGWVGIVGGFIMGASGIWLKIRDQDIAGARRDLSKANEQIEKLEKLRGEDADRFKKETADANLRFDEEREAQKKRYQEARDEDARRFREMYATIEQIANQARTDLKQARDEAAEARAELKETRVKIHEVRNLTNAAGLEREDLKAQVRDIQDQLANPPAPTGAGSKPGD